MQSHEVKLYQKKVRLFAKFCASFEIHELWTFCEIVANLNQNSLSPRNFATERCLDVDTTLFGRQHHFYNVETMSCAG